MKKELIAALDVGTSGMRAAVFRPDGSCAAQYRLPLSPARPEPGLSEYRADTILQAVSQVLNTVL